jgi:hypothetical protein
MGAARMWRYLGVGALLAVGFASCLSLQTPTNVSVEIRNVPDTTAFVCLVADRGDEQKVMDWTLGKVHRMRPEKCVMSWPADDEHSSFRRSVVWEHAARIGVITKDKKKGWQVAWFEGKKADRTGNVWQGDLRAADKVDPVASDTIKRLGLAEDSEVVIPD